MFVYGLTDPAGKIRYVGYPKDVPARVTAHWKKRNSKQRIRENPEFCAWLQGFLLPPGYVILASNVPWSQRYAVEREWTVRLAAKQALLNISAGAAPLHRGPLTEEHKNKISLALLERNRRGSRSPSAAAA